jgi:hypothetical protein
MVSLWTLRIYYFSIVSDNERNWVWYPRTYVYEEYYKLEFLQRLRSRRYIESVKMLFEAKDIEQLRSKIQRFKHAHKSNAVFGGIPSITDHVPLEEVGQYP